MKVLLVSQGHWDVSYYEPFAAFGQYTNNLDLLRNDATQKEVCLVIFTGGEDVSPEIYHERSNTRTMANLHRDKFEIEAWELVRKWNKPAAGICRGAQFICAMSGGKLVQHITGHHAYHNVRTDDGRLIRVSSTHHQMQLPPADAVSIAWAEPNLSNCYLGGPGDEYMPEKEYDVVWYPKTNALGMQYHPEFMKANTEGFQYCGELVTRFFGLVAKKPKEIGPLDFTD
jgi:gamma-glutamyl-gamma-aminobutyrate hydrolase PuuD